jgi:hypothetical protein
MPFLSKLRLEDTDGRKWKLLEPLEYRARTGAILIVPAGFITDFASVPRLLWRVLPPSGPYNEAAVLHDYLYRTSIVPRKRADELFREAMQSLGVSRVTRWIMYLGVRAGGSVAYKGKK